MKRLFEAIQYQDFAITFKSDNSLGASFRELNVELNAVINSFNNVRAESEANLHFIQAIVQQINVGILSYNSQNKIEIANSAATKLLKVYRLKNMANIEVVNKNIFDCIKALRNGETKLLKVENDELSFTATEIQLRDRKLKLVAIHSLRSELQERELNAWQNLTKVLRHEIMNSVTPIVSLVETMKEIVISDLEPHNEKEKEAIGDLRLALETVQKRGRGIMNFVDAYREFTTIPLPNIENVDLGELLKNVLKICEKSATQKSATLTLEVKQEIMLQADMEQIEQVMINLIKNALEADYDQNPTIMIKAQKERQQVSIKVIDNAIGIDPKIQDQIFIPFFTSKKTGSGIGLSLSRQIIQLHGGSLIYNSNNPQGSVFEIRI